MKLIVASFILSGLMTSTALAQTSASAQNSASTSNSTSISASKSGVEGDSRSSANATEQTSLMKNNNQAGVAAQTQTNTTGHVAIDNSGTANQLKGSGLSLTSGSLSRNSNNAFVGGSASGRTGTSSDVASTGAVVRSSVADSAHFKPLSASASHNRGDRAIAGLQGSRISSSANASSALNSRSSSGKVEAATHAAIQKK